MTRMHHPRHPGETLREDVLQALGLTLTAAAKQLCAPRFREYSTAAPHSRLKWPFGTRVGSARRTGTGRPVVSAADRLRLVEGAEDGGADGTSRKDRNSRGGRLTAISQRERRAQPANYRL